jgi:hypothetical protein
MTDKPRKYYVKVGDYRLVVSAQSKKEACVKTLRRFLDRDSSMGSETDTITAPSKVFVSEQGFGYHKDNDEDESFDYLKVSGWLDQFGDKGEFA